MPADMIATVVWIPLVFIAGLLLGYLKGSSTW